MISCEKVEDVFPCPVRLVKYLGSSDFDFLLRREVRKILKIHNSKYDTKIKKISVIIENPDMETEVDNICLAVNVGKETVYQIKDTDFFERTEDRKNPIEELNLIMQVILDIFHDKIVEIQEENEAKVEQFQQEGYDEMLYAYYSMTSDDRAFLYLKKLAMRYPKSIYMRKLRRVYKIGRKGYRPNIPMFKKLTGYDEELSF